MCRTAVLSVGYGKVRGRSSHQHRLPLTLEMTVLDFLKIKLPIFIFLKQILISKTLRLIRFVASMWKHCWCQVGHQTISGKIDFWNYLYMIFDFVALFRHRTRWVRSKALAHLAFPLVVGVKAAAKVTIESGPGKLALAYMEALFLSAATAIKGAFPKQQWLQLRQFRPPLGWTVTVAEALEGIGPSGTALP